MKKKRIKFSTKFNNIINYIKEHAEIFTSFITMVGIIIGVLQFNKSVAIQKDMYLKQEKSEDERIKRQDSLTVLELENLNLQYEIMEKQFRNDSLLREKEVTIAKYQYQTAREQFKQNVAINSGSMELDYAGFIYIDLAESTIAKAIENFGYELDYIFPIEGNVYAHSPKLLQTVTLFDTLKGVPIERSLITLSLKELLSHSAANGLRGVPFRKYDFKFRFLKDGQLPITVKKVEIYSTYWKFKNNKNISMKGNHLWKSRESLLSQEISLYVPMEVFLSRVKISFTINLVYESLGKDFTKTINVSYNPTNQLWEQVEKIN